MLENEAALGKQPVNRLLLRDETVSLPGGSNNNSSIEVATSLVFVPSFFRTFPTRKGRPYAIFAIHGIESPFFETKETELKQELPTAIFTASSMLLLTDFNLGSAEESVRVTLRQLQRLGQFQRLMGISDRWERNLDGVIPINQEEPTRWLLRKFRHIAASWFADELLKEPLTKQTVNDMIRTCLPQLDSILEATGELLRVYSFNLSDIQGEVANIFNPSSKKEADPHIKELQRQAKAREQEESKHKPDDVIEGKKELETIAKAEIESYRAKISEVVYVHDSMMDEPSQDAAAYFKELWDRTF